MMICRFRAKAGELGLPSLATAAMIGWEWLQRETDISRRSTSRTIVRRASEHGARLDEKTRAESWIPLFDDAGVPLYPELMAELDAIKRERIGGLMLCRDWGERGPWPTWPKPDEPDFTHLAARLKRSSGPLACGMSCRSHRSGIAVFTEGAKPS